MSQKWGYLFIPIIDLRTYMIYVITMRRHVRGRAMQFKCHATEADSACCKHETITPLHLAITPVRLLAPRQPLATIGVLPVAAAAGALPGNQCGHRIFDLFPAHSP